MIDDSLWTGLGLSAVEHIDRVLDEAEGHSHPSPLPSSIIIRWFIINFSKYACYLIIRLYPINYCVLPCQPAFAASFVQSPGRNSPIYSFFINSRALFFFIASNYYETLRVCFFLVFLFPLLSRSFSFFSLIFKFWSSYSFLLLFNFWYVPILILRMSSCIFPHSQMHSSNFSLIPYASVIRVLFLPNFIYSIYYAYVHFLLLATWIWLINSSILCTYYL